jgi:PPOX class probable F420-dependent enzyme
MPSRREMIRMTPEETEAFLHGRHTMNIATFGPDGNIHLIAMWYGFFNGNPAFETFTKSQKVQNLRRDPRITVLVADGETYDTLRGIEIVGKAIIHDDTDVLFAVARDVVGRYFDAATDEEAELAALGLTQKRVAIEIVADKIVTWDHGKLAGT